MAPPRARGRSYARATRPASEDLGMVEATGSALRIAGALLVLAVVLAIVGLVIRVVRWLLIVAAVLVLLAAGARWMVGRRSG